MTNNQLERLLLDLRKRCKCSKIRVVTIDDDIVDSNQHNTIQILNNGEVWFIACDGEEVLLDSGAGAGHDALTLNADQPTQDSANLVGQELQLVPVTDTTYGVMSPSDKTKLDALIGTERTITVVANYAALPAPATVPNEFYFAEASQGTAWLPGSLGGTYYPAGLYYSTGATWITDISPWQATQLDVDAGIITDQFVSPFTLVNAAQWDTKQEAIQFEDEGIALGTLGTVNSIDFVGAGVVATRVLDVVTVTIGGNGDILNGGNTTGAAITIGTNDAFDLNLETSGVERLNITGGAATGGAFRITNVTANTATVQDVLTLRTNSTGTAAANFGGAILFQGESTTTDNQDMVRLSSIWTTATHASRASVLVFENVTAAGALTERFRFTSSAMTIAAGYTIGNSGNQLTVGGSTGTVNISSSSSVGINLTASGTTTGRVTVGTTAFTATTLAKEAIQFTDTYTVASGTGTFTAIAIDNTFNLTGTASGVQRGIHINPVLTSLTAATYRGVDIAYDNAAAYGIYQSGASTKNIFVGLTSHGMTTDPVGAYIDIAAGTTALAQINLTPGVAPTAPNDGDIYYVDTNDRFMVRKGALDSEIISASAVTTEAVVSDRTITVSFNGVTYKLLALA